MIWEWTDKWVNQVKENHSFKKTVNLLFGCPMIFLNGSTPIWTSTATATAKLPRLSKISILEKREETLTQARIIYFWERKVERRLSSLSLWFLLLFMLVALDIFSTNPVIEGNPLTLYLWAQFGIFFSAWIKIGQVLLFGVLCFSAKRIAKPNEWVAAKKILLGLLGILVAFYIFVVSWNIILSIFYIFH